MIEPSQEQAFNSIIKTSKTSICFQLQQTCIFISESFNVTTCDQTATNNQQLLFFYRGIYRIMRKWNLKRSPKTINTVSRLRGLLRGSMEKFTGGSLYYLFTINIKSRWELYLTLRLCVMFGVTLQIFLHWFPCRSNSLAALRQNIFLCNNFSPGLKGLRK